jgi:hypothetical protein
MGKNSSGLVKKLSLFYDKKCSINCEDIKTCKKYFEIKNLEKICHELIKF